MHSQRILTALAAGPLLLAAILWGGCGLFNMIVAAMAAMCLFEYYHAVFPGNIFMACAGIAAGLIPVVSVIVWQSLIPVVPAVYAVLLLSVFVFIFTYSRWQNCFESWAFFLLGAFYVSICSLHLILIRGFSDGVAWIIFVSVVIFSGDSGAYYIGRAIGRKKLCPAISSGKTMAGAAGGLLLNVLAGIIMWFILLRHIDPRFIVPLVLLLGAVGQLGDLAESVIKRASGVKDSGSFLPGHGGFFDRVDALLLSAPLLYWILVLAGHFHLFGVTERLNYYAT